MRPRGSAAELESRRRQAVELFQRGEPVRQITQALGVARGSLYRWARDLRADPRALDSKPHPGRARRLTAEQMRRLAVLLRTDPSWSPEQVAALIRQQFGVSFHCSYLRKLLRDRFGYAPVKPSTWCRRDPSDSQEIAFLKETPDERIISTLPETIQL